MITRRRFLQVGLAGAAVLAAAAILDRRPEGGPWRALDPRVVPLMGAIAGVVLEGSLPAEPAARSTAVREVVEAFDRAVAGLSPSVQDEIGQLLALLRILPTRLALTGIASPLEEAPPARIAAFLQEWRVSRFDLLRAGYQALTQLVQAAWYDNPGSWAAIGYPGPPPGIAT